MLLSLGSQSKTFEGERPLFMVSPKRYLGRDRPSSEGVWSRSKVIQAISSHPF